jgi:hypothetical protein
MISYLKTWAMEANCLGFEHPKHSHACISTDMEDGLYTWVNREALIEAQKNIITAPMPVKEPRSYQETFSKTINSKNQQFNGRKPDFSKADPGEKTALPCYNFNDGKCRQGSYHETASVLWRHICAKCLNDGHVSKDCTRYRSS